MSMVMVRPLSGAAPWRGGKSRRLKKLLSKIEITPHKTYAEVFMGMGGVFFGRTLMPGHDVINDRSHDVFNLFRVVQRHYREFLYVMRFQMQSRITFQQFLQSNPDTLTDIERAARLYYLQRYGFGGKVNGKVYGVDIKRSRFNIRKIKKSIQALHDRLEDVTIECLDYSDFLSRYDAAETLFYLDPPYWGCEGDYGKALFSRSDFTKMAEQLASIEGRFLLSLNDVPEVREVFSAFEIEAVRTQYTIGSGKPKQVGEVIISNYNPEREAGCLSTA